MGLIEQYTPSVYVETSTCNFAVAEKSSDKQQAAQAFFALITRGRFRAYTSNVVTDELKRASAAKQHAMFRLLSQHRISGIHESDRAKQLARWYIDKGIIPEKCYTDALHIAIASVNRLNFVVSYNFGHIVKLQTLNMTGLVNVRLGYPQIGLISPLEILNYEQAER